MAEYLSRFYYSTVLKKIYSGGKMIRGIAINDVIKFLKNKYPNGIQMFDNRNIAGDKLRTIYDKNNIIIDCCDYWKYIEILGLKEDEFDRINKIINKNCPEYLMSGEELAYRMMKSLDELMEELNKLNGRIHNDK